MQRGNWHFVAVYRWSCIPLVDNPDDEMSCTFRAQLPPSRHDNHKALRTAIDASRLTSSAVSNTPSNSLHAYHHHRRFDHVMQHLSRTLKNIKALPANDFHSATNTPPVLSKILKLFQQMIFIRLPTRLHGPTRIGYSKKPALRRRI